MTEWKPGDTAPLGHILVWGKPEDLRINGELLTAFDGPFAHTATWDDAAGRFIMDGGSRFGPFVTPLLWADAPQRPIPLKFAMEPREKAVHDLAAAGVLDPEEADIARTAGKIAEIREAANAESGSRINILRVLTRGPEIGAREHLRDAAASAYFRSLADDLREHGRSGSGNTGHGLPEIRG